MYVTDTDFVALYLHYVVTFLTKGLSSSNFFLAFLPYFFQRHWSIHTEKNYEMALHIEYVSTLQGSNMV